MRGNVILYGAIGVIVLLGLFVMLSYNGFVSMDQDVNAKWSEVENQYQRQSDLVPNLVSVVSSSVRIETSLLQNVTEARSRWQSASGLLNKDIAGVQMTNGITALVTAVSTAENYPELQANKQYVALTDELAGTQNRISVARGRYIESIQKFNTAVKQFPGNVLAGSFGFSGKEYYQAKVEAMQTPSLGSGQLP
ncbi:LemA family protein [Candidatus Micrarchaeota archaeon]|nr:LemA family protein [Candidatus Micrarchaeota archaeon]